MTINTQQPGLPTGWLATTIGGTLGTIAGGFIGMMMSQAYVDTSQQEGLEGIGTLIAGTLVGAFLGAAGGAGTLVRLRRHARPLASGLLFATLGTILLLLFGTLGSMVVPEQLHAVLGTVTLGLLTPAAAGIATRACLRP